MAELFCEEELEIKYLGRTVLSINQHMVNLIMAIKKAMKILQDHSTTLPARNTSLKVVCFFNKRYPANS